MRPEDAWLDRQHMWLRTRFVVGEAERAMFWQKIENQYRDLLAKKNLELPPTRWLSCRETLPEPSIALAYWARTAEPAASGRPRWVGYGSWHGGPLLRECKALVPSGWTRAHGDDQRLRLNDIARGKYRSPDPWYNATGNLLVRRLSPNNRKLDVADQRDAAYLLHPDLLWAMGRDLAAIHLGVRDLRDALRKDLEVQTALVPRPRRNGDGIRSREYAVENIVEIALAINHLRHMRHWRPRPTNAARSARCTKAAASSFPNCGISAALATSGLGSSCRDHQFRFRPIRLVSPTATSRAG